MNRIKHLVFDFDGTLVDSKGLFVEVYNRVAIKYGYRLMEASNLKELKSMSYWERVKFLKVPVWRLPLFIPQLYKQYKSLLSSLEFFEGIEPVLEKLHAAGFTMDIVSSNTEENIREFMRMKNIPYFNQVLCSKKLLKKDVLLTRLIRENNYSQAEVLYLGDEARDLAACNKLGIDTLWVAWGYDVIELILPHHPTYMAQQPDDLVSILTAKI